MTVCHRLTSSWSVPSGMTEIWHGTVTWITAHCCQRRHVDVLWCYWNTCIVHLLLFCTLTNKWGTRWRSWLRHCATSRKVAVSIPDSVIGIFHRQNPSGRTMALGLTQPLTEISTRNISWGKGGRCVELTILPPSCADCLEIWEPQPPGTLRACPGL